VPFDLALDAGQHGQTNLFCFAEFQNQFTILTAFPTAVGPATATEMNVVYSGYFIDIP